MFAEQLRFGDSQQTRLERWLVANGCVVQPCNATPTGGGRIYGPGMALANPDMMVFNAERFTRRGQLGLFSTSRDLAFVEVKAKRSFTFFRLAREWQTGIDAPRFDDYRKVEEACGQTVWLFFVHLSGHTDQASRPYGISPSGLYCQRLGALVGGRRFTMKQVGRAYPMIYWPESKLIKLAAVEELDYEPR